MQRPSWRMSPLLSRLGGIVLAIAVSLATLAHGQVDPRDRPVACQGDLASAGMILANDGILLRRVDLAERFPGRTRFLPYFAEIATALSRRGVTLVMAPVPTKAMALAPHIDADDLGFDVAAAEREYRSFLADLRELGLLSADLLTPLRQADWSAEANPPNLRKEIHWSPRGAEVSAQAVADAIAQHGRAERLPRTPFTTIATGSDRRRPPILERAEAACGAPLDADVITRFVTEAQGGAAEDLFTDRDIPLLLVGTSYSQPAFNFAGFLSQATSLDLLEVPVNAGGLTAALEEALTTPLLDEARPSFLVWEFPFLALVQGPLERNEVALRQLVAASHGECTAPPRFVTLKSNGDAVSASIDLNAGTSWNTNYLLLDFAEPERVTEGVTFHITYVLADDTRVREQLFHERTTRIENVGRLFMSFDGATRGRPHTVSLEMPGTEPANVAVRVCRKEP